MERKILGVFLCLTLVSIVNCQNTELDCSNVVCDLIFVVDRSGSITLARWPTITAFVCELSQAFDVSLSKTRIAMIVFGSECQIEFDLDDYTNNDAICSAANAIPYAKGSTNIFCGFQSARSIIQSDILGDRPDVENVVLLVTDGKPTKKVDETIPEANMLKQVATIVSVGVSNKVNTTLLMILASNPSFFTFISNFDELDQNVEDVSNLLCEAALLTTTTSTTTTTPAAPGGDPCYRCTDYDDRGFGYINDTDPSLCHVFWLCKTDPVTGINQRAIRQTCPPGTMYNSESSAYGIPCVHDWQLNKTGCVDNIGNTDIDESQCHYLASVPNDNKFWIVNPLTGTLEQAGDCGRGGLFNQALCTCVITGHCDCRLDITFEGDLEDHSCRHGHVTKEGPVDVPLVQSGPFNMAGLFVGRIGAVNNGGHLKAWSLNGAYSGGSTNTLSVSVWFNADGPLDRLEGLVTYGDCFDDSPSYYIWLKNGQVCAGIKSRGFNNKEICMQGQVMTGAWYYAAMVYDMPTFQLYVTTRADYFDCQGGASLPTCDPAVEDQHYGFVESRNCGVQVGLTGNSQIPADNFFRGLIDEVEISDNPSYEVCPP